MTSEADVRKRLETLSLYEVMDTPPDAEFDDIVLLAAELCKTPVALVSLVERDRQWFKARVGFEACETPISQSVCAHALGGTDLLIIPDLCADPRTSANRLVTHPPHIRFYAGAPLVLGNGVVVGTLCVIDTEIRPEGLTESQKAHLAALARQVVILLELRRISSRKDDLFRRQKRISAEVRAVAASSVAAQEAGGIGTFDIDIASDVIRLSPEACRILRLPIKDEYPAGIIHEIVFDDDRDLVSSRSGRATGAIPLEAEYRISTAEDGPLWIARKSAFIADAEGKVVRMVGTIQNVTAERQSAARLEALVQLGEVVGDIDDIRQAAFDAASLMARALGATRAGFGLVDPISETVMMQRDWRAPGVATLEGLHRFRDYGSFIDDLRRGETVLISDVTVDPRTRDHAQALLDIGIRVLVNVPVFDKGTFNLVVFVHYDRLHVWRPEELDFVRSVGDRLQAGIARLRAEQEQDTLNRELSHRLKNTLSIVQAIAAQTLRTVAEREPVEAFQRRLQTLSSAHDILIHQNWTGAVMHDLVRETADGIGALDRFDLSGPSISMGPKATQSVMLMLHELATNALKYGALSVPDGRVAAGWEIEGEGEGEQLRFVWRETGGPPVSVPERRGFGSRLIRMGLLGTGGVEISYEPSGIIVTMAASLSNLQEAG